MLLESGEARACLALFVLAVKCFSMTHAPSATAGSLSAGWSERLAAAPNRFDLEVPFIPARSLRERRFVQALSDYRPVHSPFESKMWNKDF